MDGCPLCDRIKDRRWEDELNGDMCAFAPNKPVVPGHLLVMTMAHVVDVLVSPPLTGKLFGYASMLIRKRGYSAANILASYGASAGQALQHLHVHVIPRSAEDQLALPWDGPMVPLTEVKLVDEDPDPSDKPKRPARGKVEIHEPPSS